MDVNDEENDEQFSNDPDEQLRMENEILRIRLLAELGGDYQEMEDLPPDIENMFLKNVLEFEQQHANAPSKKLIDILGEPAFTLSADLSDEEITAALAKIEELMESRNIVVDYGTDYPSRQKYEFITEELFQSEASMFAMPGMTMHYIYEEFHPNHELDIRARAERFIKDWFGKSFDEYSLEIASHLKLPDKTFFTKEELFKRMALIFDSYDSFRNEEYQIEKVSFELHDAVASGFAEGIVQYDAVMETGEPVHYKGPFKFYMELDSDYWQIFFFEWPGFSW